MGPGGFYYEGCVDIRGKGLCTYAVHMYESQAMPRPSARSFKESLQHRHARNSLLEQILVDLTKNRQGHRFDASTASLHARRLNPPRAERKSWRRLDSVLNFSLSESAAPADRNSASKQ